MLPAAGVRKPRLTNELLARPPFRFVHDVVSELRNVSGFARGLFDDSTEVDARAMGKLQRIGCVKSSFLMEEVLYQIKEEHQAGSRTRLDSNTSYLFFHKDDLHSCIRASTLCGFVQ
jgi:hypothetical protein